MGKGQADWNRSLLLVLLGERHGEWNHVRRKAGERERDGWKKLCCLVSLESSDSEIHKLKHIHMVQTLDAKIYFIL